MSSSNEGRNNQGQFKATQRQAPAPTKLAGATPQRKFSLSFIVFIVPIVFLSIMYTKMELEVFPHIESRKLSNSRHSSGHFLKLGLIACEDFSIREIHTLF